MIANGGATDHSGRVAIRPIENFDLDRTIFNTLEGKLPRFLITRRIGKSVRWDSKIAEAIEQKYNEVSAKETLPPIRQDLLDFLVSECDFDVEHADGSFLDHLYFGFEYCVQHFPKSSPLVMLLHSVLGTGTNTFAMTADKIPQLQKLMKPEEWTQVSAFPSILRLLYDFPLRQTLRENAHRANDLIGIRFHRVIDNETIELSGEEFWLALNYQLVHLLDFLPVANWETHQSDTSFVLFRDLYSLLTECGKMQAQVNYEPSSGPRKVTGESHDWADFLISRIPSRLSEKLAAKSVRRFSEVIGHSMNFELSWS